MRVPTAVWSRATWGYTGWPEAREWLGVAGETVRPGTAPLPSVVREVAAVSAAVAGGLGAPYQGTRESLSSALSEAHAAMDGIPVGGPAVSALEGALGDARTQEDWVLVSRSAEELIETWSSVHGTRTLWTWVLEAFESVDVGLGDALGRLSVLRAALLAGSQDWDRVRRLLQDALTRPRDDGDAAHRLSLGPMLRTQIIEAAFPTGVKDYVVWLATLAGPHSGPARAAVVSGPVAVAGLRCEGRIGEYAHEVLESFREGFAANGSALPADVEALFADGLDSAASYDLTVIDRADKPAATFVRVAVQAATATIAVEEARHVLRAILRISGLDGHLAEDYLVGRAGTDRFGGPVSAASLGHGEVGAAGRVRDALRGIPSEALSDQEAVSVLSALALTRDTMLPEDVRLTRAWSALDTMTPGHGAVRKRLDRWALRWIFSAHEVRHQVAREATAQRRFAGPHLSFGVRDDAVAEFIDIRTRLREALTAEEYDFADIDSLLAEALDCLDPLEGFGLQAILEVAIEHRLDPGRKPLDRWLASFKALADQAQRHRNLIAHGHSIPRDVLETSVSFLITLMTIAAHEQWDGSRFPEIGGPGGAPDPRWYSGSWTLGRLRSAPYLPSTD
jgi:hypothetical protein